MRIHASLIAIFAAGLGVACATHTASVRSYTDPGAQPGTVRTLAVFPIRNAPLAPGDAQQMNRSVSAELARLHPNVRITGPAEVVRILNEVDLAKEWARFLEDYSASGVPDSKRLQSIGNALQVQAVLQGELVNVVHQDGVAFVRQGSARVTIRFSLLDTQSAKTLWEATSDGLQTRKTTVGAAPPLIDAINLALGKLIPLVPL